MLILHHAKIRTLNSKQTFASALAIENGRILAVGSNEDMLVLGGPTAENEDMHGQTIWPGLTDAHVHLDAYANSLNLVDCETPTKGECLRRIFERSRSSTAGAWILGHGFNQNLWQGGYGTADELDTVANDHPVYITAKSLHAGWANSIALKLSNIDRDTPDPEGGHIQRDKSGFPTGILLENAVQLVECALPTPGEEENVNTIDQAQKTLWSMGLTGVHDNDPRRCFVALQMLNQRDRLRLRVTKNIPFDVLSEAIAVGLRSGFGGDYLRIGSVKMFADGALGPQTAAMLQPYENSTSSGVLKLTSKQVFEAGKMAAQSGLSLAIHAIGDRANQEVLNGYALLRAYEKQNHLPHLRHRIEHAQILHPDDLRRLVELDLIASMQPIHAISDIDIADRYWGSRSHFAYAFHSLHQAGTTLVFGSDAPVESPNPFIGLHAAVNRTRSSGYPGKKGWYPEQRITLEEALEAYTVWPAFAAGREQDLGKLAPGYCADLIVLADDPFEMQSELLYNTQPISTMVAGEWVWRH